jgi:tRNA-specific 2-thiouridylase
LEHESSLGVAVAMSGGADSTAAAALTARSGRRALGVTIKLWDSADFAGLPAGSGACSSPGAAAEAARSADRLGLDHVLVDLGEEFREQIIANFCAEYAAGRTPSPCVRCNRLIKFGALRPRIEKLGFEVIATGHYARREPAGAGGAVGLRRGACPPRDQSYFLAGLSGEQLWRAAFPVGEMTREDVHALLERENLAARNRPSSQEVCFAPDGDYRRVLARYAPAALEPGPLLDSSGKQLGRHRGIGLYTIGQRRGLGVATGRPLYVQRIDAAERAVIVGPDEELLTGGLEAGEFNWIGQPPSSPLECSARVRSSGAEIPARVEPLGARRAAVRFDRPVRAVAPGQWVCLYDGERVLGGGTIERALDPVVGGR